MRPYVQPGSTQPPLEPTQSYRHPVSTPQQSQPTPAPDATPSPQDDPAQANEPLLAEWLAHHGSEWIRADALAPAVRRLIDTRERPDAIRQRLRLLAATCPELEAKRAGTPTQPVKLYRLAPP